MQKPHPFGWGFHFEIGMRFIWQLGLGSLGVAPGYQSSYNSSATGDLKLFSGSDAVQQRIEGFLGLCLS
jgi:hypothetical protein